jgi:myo-inositol-1(or 4)-monophosphatase
LRPETQLAIRAVCLAQQIADARIGADHITSKGGIDLVTDTDLACEDTIRSELLHRFPEYPVIGEERAGTPRDGHPYWLVDPICGTRPFASNIPLYCTNVALVEDGEVTVAAIGIGRTGEVLFAEHGRGARLRYGDNDVPAVVDDSSNTIWIDGKTELAANAVRLAILSKQWYVWQFSSSLAYAYLACERIAACLQFSSASVTAGSVHGAAGCLVAREAGATITDIDTGKPWKLSTSSFLMAASPDSHGKLWKIVSSAKSQE